MASSLFPQASKPTENAGGVPQRTAAPAKVTPVPVPKPGSIPSLPPSAIQAAAARAAMAKAAKAQPLQAGFGILESAGSSAVDATTRDGRIRNPVPRKLKGKTDGAMGAFGVMLMDVAGRHEAKERDADARRTSANTELAARRALQNGYVSLSKQRASHQANREALFGEEAAPARPKRPLTCHEIKAEQARLLTLLRSLHPVLVVDQICKALAFFGGIPGAPAPPDEMFPSSAEANGSGRLFVAWISEIFPKLADNQQPKQSATGIEELPLMPQLHDSPSGSAAGSFKRKRGRPSGSKTTAALYGARTQTKGVQRLKMENAGLWAKHGGGEDNWVDIEDDSVGHEGSEIAAASATGATTAASAAVDDMDAKVMLLAQATAASPSADGVDQGEDAATGPAPEPSSQLTQVSQAHLPTAAASDVMDRHSANGVLSPEALWGKKRGRPRVLKKRPKNSGVAAQTPAASSQLAPAFSVEQPLTALNPGIVPELGRPGQMDQMLVPASHHAQEQTNSMVDASFDSTRSAIFSGSSLKRKRKEAGSPSILSAAMAEWPQPLAEPAGQPRQDNADGPIPYSQGTAVKRQRNANDKNGVADADVATSVQQQDMFAAVSASYLLPARTASTAQPPDANETPPSTADMHETQTCPRALHSSARGRSGPEKEMGKGEDDQLPPQSWGRDALPSHESGMQRSKLGSPGTANSQLMHLSEPMQLLQQQRPPQSPATKHQFRVSGAISCADQVPSASAHRVSATPGRPRSCQPMCGTPPQPQMPGTQVPSLLAQARQYSSMSPPQYISPSALIDAGQQSRRRQAGHSQSPQLLHHQQLLLLQSPPGSQPHGYHVQQHGQAQIRDGSPILCPRQSQGMAANMVSSGVCTPQQSSQPTASASNSLHGVQVHKLQQLHASPTKPSQAGAHLVSRSPAASQLRPQTQDQSRPQLQIPHGHQQPSLIDSAGTMASAGPCSTPVISPSVGFSHMARATGRADQGQSLGNLNSFSGNPSNDWGPYFSTGHLDAAAYTIPEHASPPAPAFSTNAIASFDGTMSSTHRYSTGGG